MPWDVRALTPAKLAAFYKLVGGNYDALFLDSASASLAFIYRSLGCFHILQQEKDPFATPSIPALTPAGFVRWQTVQLLLCPQEHIPYLQEAVKRFEILNMGPGGPFPKILPVECLPRTPDVEMTKWHERVGDKLRIESEATTPRSAPPMARPQTGQPTDLESVTDSSIDNQSIVDASEYFRAGPLSPNRTMPPIAVPIPPPGDRRSTPQSPRFIRRDSYPHRRPTDPSNGLAPAYARNDTRRSPRKPRPASVESISSSSSRSPSPRGNYRRRNYAPSNIRTSSSSKDRSPRSISIARSPYSSNDVIPLKDELGRRHSSHVLEDYDGRDSRRGSMAPPPIPTNPAMRISNTLSPPFFAAQNGRMSTQPSPTGPTVPPGPKSPPQSASQSAPLPQSGFVHLRNSISHGSGPISSWRSKLNAYVNGPSPPANPVTSPPAQPRGGIRRSRSGGIDGRDSIVEGVRFVEGVGGDYEDENRGGSGSRRRRDYEREWESEREDRRRERREERSARRRSGDAEAGWK